MAERFLIAPFSSGLQKNLPVFMTPEDSFYELENAFVHRGVIKKRIGARYIGAGETSSLLGQLRSRLRLLVGVTDGNGDINSGGDPLPAGSVFKAGQMFSIGEEIFTVPEAGTPVVMLTAGASTVHTYDTTTGAYTIEDADPATNLYWYPCEPVMGLTLFEAGTINDHSAIAFDTRFAYRYTASGWTIVGAQIYTGDNLDYFWSYNFQGDTPENTALFTTNFNRDGATSDPMYYTLDMATWTAFAPIVVPAVAAPAPIIDEQKVITAKIILPFKTHLLFFNTYEVTTTLIGPVLTYRSHVNRVRWSAVDVPIDPTAFIQAKSIGYKGGGYIDAPTEEEIVSVQYVKDRLIVYFERSTYELVYTFHYSLPFIWQKISADLGSEATFSSIPFNNGAFTIGTTGVHFCNGVNVTRIDQKIPEEIFKFLNVSDAIKRIYGIKDYFDEMFYWSLPDQREADTDKYPDTLLVYNYENKTWAKYDDSITCFGYFEQTLSDTWEEDYQAWEDDDSAWNSGIAVPQHRQVIAGNQQGFTFALDPTSNSNALVLQVSNIVGETVTVFDHNLVQGSYVRLHNSGVAAQDIIYEVYEVIDDNNVVLEGLVVPAYEGAATLSRVSKISIKSTAWNPYDKQGMNVNLHKIIFGVKKTINGEITVNYIPSQSSARMVHDGQETGASLGTNVLETFPYDLIPLEATQDLLWHSVYFQAQGNSVQIHLTWTDDQMRDINIMQSNVEIQGLILETSMAGDMG